MIWQVWQRFDDGIERVVYESELELRVEQIEPVPAEERLEALKVKLAVLEFEMSGMKQPTCRVCGLRKKPIGRDQPVGSHFCTHHECEGYEQEPHAGAEWD